MTTNTHVCFYGFLPLLFAFTITYITISLLGDPPQVPFFFKGPVFDTHLELLKLTLTYFSTDVPNLEILSIGDIPGMSSNSIMTFHNYVSTLVH